MKNTETKKENKKVDSPFNRTINLEDMTKDDMMVAIYNCMKVMGMDKEDAESVSHQLLRILLRILNFYKINLKELLGDVLLDETEQRMMNEDKNTDDDNYESELKCRTEMEMFAWIKEMVI